MVHLPFRATRYSYQGANVAKQRANAELNALIERVERYVNQEIVNNNDATQQFLFGYLGLVLGVDRHVIEHAFSHVGGSNGWTFAVTTADRDALNAAGYKKREEN